MKVFILITMLIGAVFCKQAAIAASKPSASQENIKVQLINGLQVSRNHPAPIEEINKSVFLKGKQGFKQKVLAGLLKWKVFRKFTGIDQPTEKQLKLGRLSLIFAIAAVVVLVVPYVAVVIPSVISVLTFPFSIAALVLGIKSVRGNSNGLGLAGLILSATLLLLMLISVIFVAIFFSSGWI